jgi:hypothetical protein
VGDSTAALQQQAASYLQYLARDRASAIGETLRTVQRIGLLARDHMNQTPASGQNGSPLKFQTAPDIRTCPLLKSCIIEAAVLAAVTILIKSLKCETQRATSAPG